MQSTVAEKFVNLIYGPTIKQTTTQILDLT